jgi:hypothetical protein
MQRAECSKRVSPTTSPTFPEAGQYFRPVIPEVSKFRPSLHLIVVSVAGHGAKQRIDSIELWELKLDRLDG